MPKTPSPCLVDTGVPLVANCQAEQASPACVTACTNALHDVTRQGGLVLDSLGEIFTEYKKKLLKSGQRRPGDEFLLWVITNQWNPSKCQRVALTRTSDSPPFFAEYPEDPQLSGFDPSDCKFVATANAHADKPPILVSVDTDWANAKAALGAAGIRVEELCPADLRTLQLRKNGH
jgi:hypothetical protein